MSLVLQAPVSGSPNNSTVVCSADSLWTSSGKENISLLEKCANAPCEFMIEGDHNLVCLRENDIDWKM